MMHIRTALLALFVALGPAAVHASGQVPVQFGPGSSVLSRDELHSLLEQYEAVIASPAYSGTIKDIARTNAERIRERLESGDFQPGDGIVLSVQGEPDLPDTVAVETGPQITLPLFGEISLEGVLRSEVTDHLTREIGRFIKDPVVRAEGLMRLSIQGMVRNPGFFVVPADILVSEALMVAGGPAAESDLEDLRIERGPLRLIEGEEMRDALQEGRTLDQLNLQAGDQIFLPQRRAGPWPTLLRYSAIIGSALLLGVRIF
jgi:hypothetical protein